MAKHGGTLLTTTPTVATISPGTNNGKSSRGKYTEPKRKPEAMPLVTMRFYWSKSPPTKQKSKSDLNKIGLGLEVVWGTRGHHRNVVPFVPRPISRRLKTYSPAPEARKNKGANPDG